MTSANNWKTPGTTSSQETNKNKADLLVRNAYVVTMDSKRSVYPYGAVAMKAGRIVAVGEDRKVSPRFRADRMIDAHGAVVHPGFIDSHVHLIYHTIRWAHADGLDFNKAMAFHGEFLDKVDQEVEHAGARLACLEMARNGTTCFLESSVIDPDGAAAAIEEIGIRALIGDPVIKDIVSPGETFGRIKISRRRSFDILGEQLKRNSSPDTLVRGIIGLSGMGTASDELLLSAKAMADSHGVILNMHQSYSAADTTGDDRRLGRHPIVHYAEIGFLGKNCTFAHMNIVREDEVAPVVESGMSIAWCPIASMMYGVGGTFHGRHVELYKQGANIALGSDSANWTSGFNIGDQALLAVMTAREKTGHADALVAEDAMEMATVNGARAVGLADQLGSLEVGKRADLVVRQEGIPEAHPGVDPIRSVVYSSGSRSIDTVVVGGEVIIESGHSTRVDEEEVYAGVREASRRVLERMGSSAPTHR